MTVKGTEQEIKSLSGSKAGYSIWAVNHTIIMTLGNQVFPDDIIILSHNSSSQNENSVYSFTHPGIKKTVSGTEAMSKDGKLQIKYFQDVHPGPAKWRPLRWMGMLLDSFVKVSYTFFGLQTLGCLQDKLDFSQIYLIALYIQHFIYLILPLITRHTYILS